MRSSLGTMISVKGADHLARANKSVHEAALYLPLASVSDYFYVAIPDENPPTRTVLAFFMHPEL